MSIYYLECHSIFEFKKIIAGVFCSAVFVSAPSFAQDKGTFETMAVVTGSMHAVVDVCGGYSKEQLDMMKSEQKKMVASAGITEDEFDALFDRGYKEGLNNLATVSDSQKKEMCEQMQQMQQMQ